MMSTAAVPVDADDGRMPLMEHLTELRDRIIKVVIAVVLGMLVAFLFYEPIFDVLIEPYRDGNNNRSLSEGNLVATDPLEGFGVRMKLALYGGIFLAMPVILWQLWRFITPALYPHEKKYAVPFIGSALVLFVAGAALAYVILVPTLQFLVEVGGPDVAPLYTASSYITLIVWMMLAFGVGFEFPVVIVALELLGIVTPRRLLSWWRPALVVIVVVAAVITPSGDPISMTALALPMALLYGISIGLGALLLKLRGRKERRAEAAEAAEGVDHDA
jgi:sec-independent protein translocase protein TatC